VPATVARASELAATNAAIKALAVQLGVDEALIAKQLPPVVVPPYDPQVQWHALRTPAS
jgi:hypothetical protein